MAKRTVDRHEKLPSVRCDLAELESLVNKVVEHFGTNSCLRSSIGVDLKTEKLDFENFSDIRAYSNLPSKLTDFSIHIYDYETGRRCTIGAGGILDKTAYVSVSADNEAWCAGVTELCRDFAQRHKQWYNFINKFPVYYIFLLLFIVPIIINKITGKIFDTYYGIMGWLLGFAALLLISLVRHKSFPSAVIIIRHEKSKWREYVPELSLIVAALALIITLIGLFVQTHK